jgi:protein O-mannosyl-transferase
MNSVVDEKVAESRPYVAVALGIAILTLIAYAPICWNDFIYLDDVHCITANPEMPKGLTFETFVWSWSTTLHGFWHPLTWLSLLADVSLFGYGPLGMHLTNVVLHIATSIGLFLLFVRMTGAFWRSAFLGALFAVHPMHVESVAWAIERKDVLSTFFLVLTIASYVEAARSPSVGRHVLTSVLFTLGLLAKPMLVTLPFALLLLDVWPLGRTNLTDPESSPRFGRRSWVWLIFEKLPLFALAFGFSLLTFWLQKKAGAVVSLETLPWLPRITNVLTGYAWYLRTTLVPTHLAVVHTIYPRFTPFDVILPGVLLVAITLFFVTQVRRHPELLVGWLWFGGTLFPVSGIAQSGLQAYADRFAYVPHIGLFVVFIWGGAIGVRRCRIRPAIVTSLSAALLVICTGLTFRQVLLWRDTGTLFRHSIAVTTGNARALAILGEYYWSRGQLDDAAEVMEKALAIDDIDHDGFDLLATIDIQRGRYPEAERALRRSIEVFPQNPEPYQGLAHVLYVQQRFDEAVTVLEGLLAKDPRRFRSHLLLGEIRAAQHRYVDAIDHLSHALELAPNQPEAHQELALVHLRRNELDLAERHFAAAIRGRPENAAGWTGLFRALYRQERWQDAVQAASDAITRFPKMPVFRGERAAALYRMGRRTEAQTEYDELERLSPGWADNAATTAMRMATTAGDESRTEALELAEQAAQSTEYGKVWALEPLAAAQANLGRFEEAIATIDRALALPMLPAELTERLRDDRAKFVRRQPLREPGGDR